MEVLIFISDLIFRLFLGFMLFLGFIGCICFLAYLIEKIIEKIKERI